MNLLAWFSSRLLLLILLPFLLLPLLLFAPTAAPLLLPAAAAVLTFPQRFGSRFATSHGRNNVESLHVRGFASQDNLLVAQHSRPSGIFPFFCDNSHECEQQEQSQQAEVGAREAVVAAAAAAAAGTAEQKCPVQLRLQLAKLACRAPPYSSSQPCKRRIHTVLHFKKNLANLAYELTSLFLPPSSLAACEPI